MFWSQVKETLASCVWRGCRACRGKRGTGVESGLVHEGLERQQELWVALCRLGSL